MIMTTDHDPSLSVHCHWSVILLRHVNTMKTIIIVLPFDNGQLFNKMPKFLAVGIVTAQLNWTQFKLVWPHNCYLTHPAHPTKTLKALPSNWLLGMRTLDPSLGPLWAENWLEYILWILQQPLLGWDTKNSGYVAPLVTRSSLQPKCVTQNWGKKLNKLGQSCAKLS